MYEYALLFTILVFSSCILAITLHLSSIFRPHNPTPEKNKIYECGEEAIGAAAHLLHSRFYRIALVFLAFDVEIIFVYPVAVLFRKAIVNHFGVLAFAEVFIFIVILGLGFVYAWKCGGLQWVKSRKTFFLDGRNGKNGN